MTPTRSLTRTPVVEMDSTIPKMNGLILAGGRSLRMGEDKGAVSFHGMDQRSYCQGLLGPYCEQVYVSCRGDQVARLPSGLAPLLDDAALGGAGPAIGLLSAHRRFPDFAFLVIACDMPSVNSDWVGQLVSNRDPLKHATAFADFEGENIEPLFAVWEPRGLRALAEQVKVGSLSPRKCLEMTDCATVRVSSLEPLRSVNTPEELKRFLAQNEST